MIWELVRRCLVSMPTKITIPYQDASYCLDYGYHNNILQLVIGCLPPEQVMHAYEEFIKLMPNNVILVQR